jgi:hypothetical protein
LATSDQVPQGRYEENDENEEQPQKNACTLKPGGIDSALSTRKFCLVRTEDPYQNERPQALPSEEITAVLFDLATIYLGPDKSAAAGSLVSYRSSLVPFTGIKRPASEVI